MQPGLSRALPMAVAGFVLGAGFVVLLRALQSMDTVWEPGLGLVSAGFFMMIFFIWGMGAFDPKLGAHHVPEPPEDLEGEALAEWEAEHLHHHDEELPEGDARIFSGEISSVTMWIVVGVLVIGAFVLFADFDMVDSSDAAANTNAIGYYTIELGEQTLVVSQLTAFVGFTAFTILSLVIAGAVITWIFYSLSRGVETAKASEGIPLSQPVGSALPSRRASSTAALPATTGDAAEGEIEAVVEPEPATPGLIAAYRPLVMTIVRDVIVGIILYVVFYEALIGWIIPGSPAREILSLVNAIAIPILIFHTRFVLKTIGRVSRWLANVLRGVPSFLFQR